MTHKRRKEYISQFFKGNRLLFCIAFSTGIFTFSLNFVITWLLQQMLDSVSGEQNVLPLSVLGLFCLGILLLIILFKLISYWTKPRFLQRAMVQYKNYAFEKLTKKSMSTFRKESASRYLSAFSNDLSTIETDYLQAKFEIWVSVLELFGALAMMLWYSPLMSVIAIAFCALPAVAVSFAGNRLEKAEKIVSTQNAGFLATLQDALSGFSVMKSFGAERELAALVAESNRQAEDAKCRKEKISILLYMLAASAAVTAQMGTILTGCILSGFGHPLSPGTLTSFISLTSFFIHAIQSLPALLGKRKAALGLVDKLADALEENTEDTGAELTESLQQEIALSHLSFAYDPEKPVLKDISCTFEAGKSYAVVGASGSGKSTLLNLLMGSDSYEGKIYFDNQEMRDISSKSLCNAISMIQQNVFVFNASIRDNITMFKAFPRAQVDEAIRLSGLSALVSEKGEHYLCGENGCNLSGGEKQRISIARSLLRKTQILLADEATAALDAETAYQVSDAILNLADITRIVVTHALDAGILRRYDRIFAMKDGKIVESGSFQELMEEKAYFYSLYTVSQ